MSICYLIQAKLQEAPHRNVSQALDTSIDQLAEHF
jgi:hypothetical protein